MSQVIKISKQGINVGTATNPNDLTFSSEYNTLKYYTSGTISLTGTAPWGGDGVLVRGTIQHNLGYRPYYVLLNGAEWDGNYYINSIYDIGHGETELITSAKIGTQNLVIEMFMGNWSFYPEEDWVHTHSFAYKIFKNSLNL